MNVATQLDGALRANEHQNDVPSQPTGEFLKPPGIESGFCLHNSDGSIIEQRIANILALRASGPNLPAAYDLAQANPSSEAHNCADHTSMVLHHANPTPQVPIVSSSAPHLLALSIRLMTFLSFKVSNNEVIFSSKHSVSEKLSSEEACNPFRFSTDH
ncbi:hypothetical protein ACFX2H_024870 [Malus domestica]